MVLLVLAFLGGILTIISPCILPVLPFVFARADQPFRKSGLPLLAGMAVTFAGFAALATVGGGWIVRANQYGRDSFARRAGDFRIDAAVAGPGRPAFPAFRTARQPPCAAHRTEAADRASSDRCCWALRPACCGLPAPDRSSVLILTGAALEGASSAQLPSCCWRMPRAPPRRSPSHCSRAEEYSPRSNDPWARKSGFAASWASPCWRAWRRSRSDWTAAC